MTDVRATIALLALLTAGQGSAQVRPKAATATLSGDVYLVMASGDVKRGAAVDVTLFRYSDHDSLSHRLDVICVAYLQQLHALFDSSRALDDSIREHPGAGSYWGPKSMALVLETDTLRRGVRTITDALILGGVVAARTRTGLEAHYTFKAVRPGEYRVRAIMAVGEHEYRWWVPAVLRAGEGRTLDLNHLNVSEAASCPE